MYLSERERERVSVCERQSVCVRKRETETERVNHRVSKIYVNRAD